MKNDVSKIINHTLPVRTIRAWVAAAATLALTCAVSAQTVNIYHVPWNATDATANIQATIDNAIAPSKVILDVHSTPWYTGPIYLRSPNQQIWFANGAKVMALAGSFQAVSDCLFRITADNVKMNGYRNGVDTSAGVTTLEMRKSDYANPPYTPGESRHGISVRGGSNAIIEGFYITKTGGDGMAVNNSSTTGAPPVNVVIQDVTCDDNYRQGMSVFSVDTLTVTNCVFENTAGTAPQSGLDIEPTFATDILKAVKFVSCQFINNTGDNAQVNLHALKGSALTPINIRFESCLIDGGPQNGFVLRSLAPAGPMGGPTGTVVVKNTVVKNTTKSGLMFSAWAADRVSVTMANVDLYNCNPSGSKPLILFTETIVPPATSTYVHGDVLFEAGCHVDDFLATRTPAIVYVGSDIQTTAGVKDITGAIDVHRNSSGPLMILGSNTTNCTLTVTDAP